MRGVIGDLDSLVSAWRDAARDLGVDVRAPFNLPDVSTPCFAWVTSFGSSHGTVVTGRRSANEDIRAIAESRSMYCSEIDEESYSRYDRDLFVETLNDWGWYGDLSAVPEWYTGQPHG